MPDDLIFLPRLEAGIATQQVHLLFWSPEPEGPPIGVNQHQGGEDYPLVEPSEDIRRLLVDLSLTVSEDLVFVQPLRIQWLYGFGTIPVGSIPIVPTHTCDLRIVDAQGSVVFDTTEPGTDFIEGLWNNYYRLGRWKNGGLLLSVIWHRPAGDYNFFEYAEPQKAVIDPRCVQRRPSVLSLVDLGAYRGPVVFEAGYNSRLDVVETEAEDSGRKKTEIVWSVIPNAGKGRAPVSCDDPAVRKKFKSLRLVNNQQSNHGHLLLDAGGCYRFQLSVLENYIGSDWKGVVRLEDGTLRLVNDCTEPCSKCEDYIAAYEKVRALRDRAAMLNERFLALRDRVESNLYALLDSKICRHKNSLRLILEPVCAGDLVVALGYCNTTSQCIDNLWLRIRFTFALPFAFRVAVLTRTVLQGGNTVPGQSPTGDFRTAPVPATLTGTWPEFAMHFDRVLPNVTAYATWRMRFDVPRGKYCETDKQAELEQARTTWKTTPLTGLFDVRVGETLPGEPAINASVSKTVYLDVGDVVDGRCAPPDTIFDVGGT